VDHILNAISDRYNLKRKSGKYVGPCPKCGGSSNSDKFNIRDDGGFKCYSCDFKGDIITWLREMEGMSCPQAHEEAGRECRATSCSVADSCRLGSGQGSGGGKRRYRQSVAPAPVKKLSLPTPSIKNPEKKWQQWGSDLVDQAAEEIKGKTDVLSWLEARGIDGAAVDMFRLGWLDHDRQIGRSSIGLKDKDGKNKLWVPGGLIIPIITRHGDIHRIRVRRDQAAREKFLSKLKYVWIQGSGTHPMVIRPQAQMRGVVRQAGKIRGVVIVESELDAIAVAAANQSVMVIALGTVSAGVPESLRADLSSAPVILVALDADSQADGKPGPGPLAIAAWKKDYRQAKYWPVPDGKDPGNYAELGGDLSVWIEAGLVPDTAGNSQDLAFSPGDNRRGEGVAENRECEKELLQGEDADPGASDSTGRSDNYLQVEPGLRGCPLCFGMLFLKGDNGGYSCVHCQPVSKPGKLVKAARLRGHYVVS